MKFSTHIIAAVAFVGTINTCHAGDSNRSNKDIPGVAIANGSFTTLVAALSATDLVGALSSPAGPFTVFAPTDEAFAALPNGLVECLLQDQNLPILSDILLYHVASGEALSTDLRNGMQIPTLLQGEEVIVDLNNGVKINDATVVGADVLASNGVIHVINQVLVPPLIDVGAFLQTCRNGHGNGGSHSMMPPTSHHNNNNNHNDRCTYLGLQRAAGQYLVGPTHTCLCTYGGAWTQCRLNNHQDDHAASSSLVDIPTTAVNAGIFSTLVAALSATDLVGAISEPQGPFTVFAPTDNAFNALPNGLVSCLLEEQNLPILSDILLYHVAPGTAFSTDLSNGQQIPTLLNGVKVTVDLRNNGVKINESQVITADVRASNGVIHIIDQVLVPPRIDVGAFLQTCNGHGNGGGHGIRGSSSHHSSVQQQQPPYQHNNNNYNNHNDRTCIYLGMQRSAGQYLVGPTHTCLCTHGGAWTQCRLNNHW